MNGQFALCKHELAILQANLNSVSKDEHISEIEQFICMTKERCSCSFHNTPFKKLPRGLMITLPETVMFYLNAYLYKDCEFRDLSPYTIMQEKVVDYNVHCKVAFGKYAQTRNLTTNDMCARITEAIATRPSTNSQGGVKFHSFELTKLLHMSRSDYTIAPIPAGTISHVKQLDKYSPTGLHFTNWLGNIYADDPENNNEPITIWFVDTPTGSQIDHDEQIAQENVEKMEINSLTNNNNIDPDNIMKMIVTTPNCGMITILSKIMTTDLPIQQKILSKQEWTPKITPSGQQEWPQMKKKKIGVDVTCF